MKQAMKITTKLMALQLLTLFLVLSVVISVNIYVRNENFLSLQKRYMSLVTTNIESQIFKGIENTEIQLLAMGNDNKLEKYTQDFSEPTLDILLYAYEDIADIVSYINSDGFEVKKIVNKKSSKDLKDFKLNPLYKKSLQNPNSVVHSEVVWSEELSSYVVEFALFKQGYFGDEFYGIVNIAVPIEKYLKNIKLGDEKLYFRVLSQSKKIVFSTIESEIGQTLEIDKKISNQTMIRTTLNREDTYSYMKFLLNDSTIVLSYDYDDFMETPNKNIRFIFIIVSFIMMLIIFITYKFSLNITKSLYTLIKAVKSISKGDYSKKIEVYSNDEIGILADKFNKMIHKIEISQNEIQEKNLKLLHVNQELKKNEFKIKSINESLTVQIKEAVQKNLLKDKQLLHQSKLAQMGDMVSMIAHQWRQPLNAISATSTKLSLLSGMQMLEDSKMQEDAEFIQNQCQKMSKTIDTFMNFVKPATESKEFYFKDTIESILNIMGKQLSSHDIEVHVEYLEQVSLLGYEDLLEQVILNLLSNARDAFDEQKKENKYIKIIICTENRVPVIIIEDNAGGIEESIREKIFNPYFTTKEQGKGTGIGLYMSMDIMKKSFNGNLVYSATQDGSRFEIICG